MVADLASLAGVFEVEAGHLAGGGGGSGGVGRVRGGFEGVLLGLKLGDLGAEVLDLGILLGGSEEERGELDLEAGDLRADAGDGVDADAGLGVGEDEAGFPAGRL